MAFTVYSGGNTGSLVDNLLAANSGVVVDPASVLLRASGLEAVNFYDGSIAGLGIGAGLLLTSGYTPGLVNDIGWDGADNSGSSGFANGDADIDAVVNTVFQTQSYDATTLEFAFTASDPNATSISFDIVFGSEEFPEWVDQFVDCAVVMVNGVNYALFNHDPLHPLSVVSSNLAAGYFQDNAGGLLAIQYDGVSQVLKIVAPINGGGAVNQIKIGIADTGDHIYDSGLFIANLSAGNIPGSGVVSTSDGCTGGDDTVTGSLKDEYFDLQAGNDTVYAGAGDDIVVGGDGNDAIYGGSGADQLEGDAGDDCLDGGADSDTAVFAGNLADYTVAAGAAGTTFSSTADGVDTLLNVELVQFKDGLYALAGDVLTAVDTGGGPISGNAPGIAGISGIGAVGSVLTALVSDADGIAGEIGYQWYADGLAIDGATTATLLVDTAYAGAVISFTASYTDGQAAGESLTSAGKAIASANDGDFAIELIQLAAPAGACVENPLTTLVYDLIQLGVSPNEAGVMVKSVLAIDPAVDLRTYDAWAELSANPGDALAFAVEKLIVQVAVITSAGGDQSGMALAQRIATAFESGSTIDLSDLAFITAFIGEADPYGVILEIHDRNVNLRDASDLAKLESEWSDFQSGLAMPVSNTVADLCLHLNQAPQGVASAAFETAAETALTFWQQDLLAGFSDPEGDVLSVIGLAIDQGGELTDNNDGSWTFTPTAGYSGPVEMTYGVTDGLGASASASTMLIVAAAQPLANTAPELTGPQATLAAGSEDLAYTVSDAELLAGFTDSDGDLLAVSGLTASNGVVVDNGDGTHTITPGANFHGTVDLGYEVSDGQGGALAANLSYALAAVNDAPTGGVSISGLAKLGQTLSAVNTLADVDGLGAIGYQWSANGVAILGATGASYLLSQAEVGKTITVAAAYTDGDGTLESVASAATLAVQAADLTLTGTSKADTLNGASGNDSLAGLGGIDTLNGYAGNDFLNGGAGTDKLFGGEGSDIYSFALNSDHAAAEIADSGTAGVDEVRFAATSASKASLTTLTLYAADTGIEKVVIGTGSGQAANSSGTLALNINAAALKNGLTLIGNAGANKLVGSAYTDTLIGGLGNDTLNGGSGSDTASYADAAAAVTVSLALTTAQNTLGAGSDTLASIENLIGSAFSDTLSGNAGNNVLTGGAGADRLDGGAGSDVFAYLAVGDSNQANTDIVSGFDFAADRFHFDGLAPTGGVALDLTGTEFANLATTLDASTMAVGEAVLVHVLNGVAQGRDFLLVDGNGVAGFQVAGDYAIELVGLLNRASFDYSDLSA